jgi:two-component system response regulator AtoC
MPYPLQAKLLRVLQEGVIERIGSNKPIRVDVRVVSSTHRDLQERIRDGAFREDLFYRLDVFEIRIPPLRDRREDVGHLATFFLARFAHDLGRSPPALSDDVRRLLERHDWPGNVRELQNLMERAAVLTAGAEVDPGVFRALQAAQGEAGRSEEPPESFALEPAVEQVERKTILRALAAANDNKVQAAKLLGVSERTLWYKLKRYGL